VSTAARLQTSSEPGRIHISAETARRLGPGWRIEPRGAIELKGLGEVASYFLIGGDARRPQNSADTNFVHVPCGDRTAGQES